jgi:hypothetical protein
MPSLFDNHSREAIRVRILKLRADSKAQWGTLDAARLLCHWLDGMEMTFGERDLVAEKGFLNTALGRWLVIDMPLPWPKGAPTMKELWTTKPGDFAADRKRVLDYLDRFAKGREQKWGVSPKTGHLTADQWARLSYRHFDHHLRQFGC